MIYTLKINALQIRMSILQSETKDITNYGSPVIATTKLNFGFTVHVLSTD